MIDQGDLMKPKLKKNKNQIKETTIERSDPLYSEIPEWLQEFRENLVDDLKIQYTEILTQVLLMKFL